MPELLPGAVFIGILTVFAVVILRLRALKPRLSLLRLLLIGVAAAYVVPPVILLFAQVWRSTPWLPELPTVTSGQIFLGGFAAVAAITLSQQPGQPPRLPIWAVLLIAVTVAFGLPRALDWATGSYQNASLRSDVNYCARGMTGQVQPQEVTNACVFAITVGLCLPTEMNPTACAQSITIPPGESALFAPGDARLSSVPGNPDGLTVVACRPPSRPSRWGNVTGRGFRGVCLPPA